MKRKIVYIAPRIGGSSGAVKSAYDVLLSLLVNSQNVIVITNTERIFVKIPKKYNGYKVNSPEKWVCLKRKNIQKKGLIKGLVLRFLNLFKQEVFNDMSFKSLLIVNSICDYHSLIGSAFRANVFRKINIVRGSPNSFDKGFNNISLQFVEEYQNEFDKLIFVSFNTKDSWFGLKNSRRQPYYYIPNCGQEEQIKKFDNLLISKVREKLDLNESPIIVCLGSIQKRKGQDFLLKIVPYLKNHFDQFKIVLVGGVVDGYGESIVEQINISEFSNSFHLTGFVNNPLDYLFMADLVILPSKGEALPRSLIEALSLGKPIIATNVDGNSELVINDFNGYLYEISDLKDCIDKIIKILKDESLKKLFGFNSKIHYSKNFSQIVQIENYKNFLENESKI